MSSTTNKTQQNAPSTPNKGTIYLIKFCDTSGKCIYKIGKSINVENRFRSYHYSDILFLSGSNDIDNDERALIKIFTKQFTLDKGKEFFECKSENAVKTAFMSYFMQKHQENPETIVKYRTTDTAYGNYKRSLLTDTKPQRNDPFCEYLYLTGENARKFITKIKPYGCNLKIDVSHVANMKANLLEEKTPYLLGCLAVIEYVKHEADTIDNLIELIDGHHRVECLRQIYAEKPQFNIGIWIALHKGDTPDGEETRKIFKKYNLLKPFIVDVSISDIAGEIIELFNVKFAANGFIPIKDSDYVVRPSIKKSVFNTALQVKIEAYKTNKKVIDKVVLIGKFDAINSQLAKNDLQWLNGGTNTMKSSKNITEGIYKNSVKYNFYLGLVDIGKMIDNVFS